MPLEKFIVVAEKLRSSGYRPIRMRPYGHGQLVRVAAVWTRDSHEWHLVHDRSATDVRKQADDYLKHGFRPVDVAGYFQGTAERYAVLWVSEPAKDSLAQLAIGLSLDDLKRKAGGLASQGYRRSTLTSLVGLDGKIHYAAIWIKGHGQTAPDPYVSLEQSFVGCAQDYSGENYVGVLQVDVHVCSLGRAAKEPHAQHYTALWHPSPLLASREIHGVDPVRQLARSQEWSTAGYRPVSISAATGLPSQAGLPGNVGGPETCPRAAANELITASVWQRPLVLDTGKETLAKRQAAAALALLRMGHPESVWPLLKHSPDPRLRSYLIDRLGPTGTDPALLLQQLHKETEPSVRRALLLALGEFGPQQLPLGQRELLVPELLDLYRFEPDPGLHAAVEWLLRHWLQQHRLTEVQEEWVKDLRLRQHLFEQARRQASSQRSAASASNSIRPHWYVNGQGQKMVVISGPLEFVMGSPAGEADREGGPEGTPELQHKRNIDRSYAIAAHEVTVEQFLKFRPDHAYSKKWAATFDCPVNMVSWYDAAAYCNWLSEKEGIPPEEWCYDPDSTGKYQQGMKLRAGYLKRLGYRLPSEAEWEFACRAGTSTSRYYGETPELLDKYAWYVKNLKDRGMLPIGTLKPNDLGLFDVLGNGLEWCQEGVGPYSLGRGGNATNDIEDTQELLNLNTRMLRGGSFAHPAEFARSANRSGYVPSFRTTFVSFRLAKTIR
jgi:formylglycine-generating enzyme required for sulfatase activity